ncbi:hypothetical protein L3Y34_019439 [Caenorhabditis briggsae]|uniref:Uncharacterized protein n=1 Tax=Caenorhabditis briggsae TaxID=6238 RepID=A0AAE9DPU1_CAEBR|nr:hypothetical protein L3Y34_019439 [Caenorhabditis briggsae]
MSHQGMGDIPIAATQLERVRYFLKRKSPREICEVSVKAPRGSDVIEVENHVLKEIMLTGWNDDEITQQVSAILKTAKEGMEPTPPEDKKNMSTIRTTPATVKSSTPGSSILPPVSARPPVSNQTPYLTKQGKNKTERRRLIPSLFDDRIFYACD